MTNYTSWKTVVASLALGASSMAVTAPAQTVIDTIPIDGQPGAQPFALGIDPATDRLYIADPANDVVWVVDTTTNQLIGDSIPIGDGVAAPFDDFPFSVGVDSTRGYVYVANEVGDTLSVLDGTVDPPGPASFITTAAIGDGPSSATVDPATGLVYVSIFWEQRVAVARFDPSQQAIDLNPAIAVGAGPFGVGINTSIDRLYVANELDGVSVGRGTLSVIGLPVSPVPIAFRPGHVVVNESTGLVYITHRHVDLVTVFDDSEIETFDGPIVSELTVGDLPFGLDVNVITSRVYVANQNDNTVSIIDGNSNTIVDESIPVGAGPHDIKINPDTGLIYIANQNDATVSVIADPDALIDATDLGSGLKNSLRAKLDNARKNIESGNNNAARNNLSSFINQVEALSGNVIEQATALQLIAAAEAIAKTLEPV